MRVVMGKENFENWVRSMQVRMPTNFEHEVDLVVSVRKAGYDAERWAGLIKTHFKEGQEFFWELVEGKWTAVFAKSQPQDLISQFIEDLEAKSGRKVFGATVGTDNSTATVQTFPTNFRDEQLLVKTLREQGLRPTVQPYGGIACTVDRTILRFRPVQNGPFSVEIENAPSLQPVFRLLSTLDEDYKHGVQATAYESLMGKIEEKHLIVESEVVLDDNSIVITLNVQE
jgi:hypothetical protein